MGKRRRRYRYPRNSEDYQNRESQVVEVEELPCSVCSSENPPYKCPSCRTKYCSVKCCKAHKESGQCVAIVTPNTEEPASTPPKLTLQGRIYKEHSYPTEDTVSVKCMMKLVEGENLKKMKTYLESKKIRSYIKILNCSKDPEPEIEAMMQDDEFAEFSAFALDIVSVPEDDDPTKTPYENYIARARKELYAFFAGQDKRKRKKCKNV